MADPRFFSVAGPFTLAHLADISGAELALGADGQAVFHDVAPLDTAGAGQISFLDNRKYLSVFKTCQAGAVLVHPDLAHHAPQGVALLLSKDPYRAYAKVAQAFYPRPVPQPWIAPTAQIDPSARIGDGARIEPGVVIGARVEMGARCHIGANVVIGDGVVLGDDCVVGSNASVSFALIGSRVTLYPGVRIGQDGFGFAMGAAGHLKVPQLGRVIIGDDVEVGANTTIDRGAGPDTVIGAGSMIDNLVQIGHNVHLGRGCVIVAQVGISGSCHLGDFVAAGGQAGFAGHLTVGPGAKIAAQSGVIRDIAPGAVMGGTPALPQAEWLRSAAILSRLAHRKG